MIINFFGKRPRIGKNVFIAPNATVVGDVEIGDGSSIWYGTVVRGETAPIVIGANSNIQDNCVLHADPGSPCVIGENVTVGHGAIIHGCTIEADCLIGMGAIVMNDVCVKAGSIVAAGSVVTERQEIGPCQMVKGIPAEVKKQLSEKETNWLRELVQINIKLSNKYLQMQAETSIKKQC
ncbi:MAG: gamma carbonic anhydrase family protein [Deltaproteobacteria bacterium]|nr:gamma carbonic anhydrase family protein [Deltaproteobacteria bacterium]